MRPCSSFKAWRAFCALLGTLTAAVAAPYRQAAGEASLAPSPARVQQLASMLPRTPRGVGQPIGDRQAWQTVAHAPGFERAIAAAEKLLGTPIPELTDELFLDFSRTGNRTRCQRVLSQRHSRVTELVAAECLENKGRFLPAIEKAIRAVCSEKTWVMPAHDRDLRNFRGEVNEIDLAVAGFSWEMATAWFWLGDRLSPEVRQLIRAELERRTLAPFEGAVTSGTPALGWLQVTNNWNAVCLAGVTGTALAVVESPQRRAFFVAAAEKSIHNFLRGFTPDGYCSEGIGYWNYGFGHFILLAETLHQATAGQLDLMQLPKIEAIARFGKRMEILPGVYPAFADCHVGARPSDLWMAYVSRRLKLGLADAERRGLLLAGGPFGSLVTLGLIGFPNSASATPPVRTSEPQPELREWFADAGILICRPASGAAVPFGVALKGGHNAEHHNHNDVGSYVVAVGNHTPLLDPGSEVYTARTFSSRRYQSNVLNSYGHPVPRVAGQLQQTGRSAEARVVETVFRDEADRLVLDLRPAYQVPGLKELKRTFVYSRGGRGSLTVTDEVELNSPQAFGTALITFDSWKRVSDSRLVVGQGRTAVQVDVATGGLPFQLQAEQIKEELPDNALPTRIGIDLAEPAAKATITVVIAPLVGS